MWRFALALLATPAFGGDIPGAAAWLAQNTATPLELRSAGSYTVSGGAIIVADPLTYAPHPNWVWIKVHDGKARLYLMIDPETDRVSKAALVFSDAAPVCGHDEATVGVDTGLAAFLNRADATELDTTGNEFADAGKDIYNDWFHERISHASFRGKVLPLPKGGKVAMTTTGWGDGGYPVASLSDANGKIVAVYADFMGRNAEGTWLLPKECAK